MTVIKMQRALPYLLLVTILLILFPMITGGGVTVFKAIFKPEDKPGLDYGYIVWGGTLFYGTWSFLLFVLFPYSFIYLLSVLSRMNIIFKLLAFFILLTLMGFLVPEGSVIDFFGTDPYPRSLLLYFLLTITLCPLCNIALDRIAKNRYTMG